MAKPPKKPTAPALTPEESKRVTDLLDNAIAKYTGDIGELESALGMYVMGRHVGWRVLYIMHSKKTVAKYEEILGINVREEFPEEGPDAHRSVGYTISKKFSNFWKVVSGEEKIDRADRRAMSE